MGKPRLALDPVADLARRLARRPSLARSALRACVLAWWGDQALGEHPSTVGKRVALALLEHPRRDAKLAGVLVLTELFAEHLRTADLASFERLLASGALADAVLVDELAIDVLGAMLLRVRGRGEVARVLASWRDGATVWQRRAACVAFTVLAPQGEAALPGLVPLLFSICSTVVWSPERLDQTAVGWLLRELSRADPASVEAFFSRHARFMSRECARQAIECFPSPRRQELLADWKRATTIRG